MPFRPFSSAFLVAGVALATGWCLRGLSLRPVLAEQRYQGSASAASVDFELSSVGRDTALTVYDAGSHTLYVYPGVTQGNATVNCEYMLHLARAGGPVQRENCAPGDLLPAH